MKKRLLSLILSVLMLLSVSVFVAAESEFELGDITRSGSIDMMDYVLLKRNYFGTFDLDSQQITLGDVNKSGAIDMMDYILLKRVYFGTYKIGDAIPVIPELVVVDGLNYERNVIPADFAGGQGFEDYKHKIILPKLNIDSVNANKLNEKIYNENSYGYEQLKNNQEGTRIYNIDYEFAVRDNVVSIIVWESVARQGAGGSTSWNAYYYDLTNDCEITFTKYLAALDFTLSSLSEMFIESPEYKEVEHMMYNGVHIVDALIDAESALVIYDQVDSMDRWWSSRFTLAKVNDSSKEDAELTVIDAINYKKPTVALDCDLCDPCMFDGSRYHEVKIPKIEGKNTYMITLLNNKMYNDFIGVYNYLINDKDYGDIYTVNYVYTIRNNTIAISVSSHRARHGACGAGTNMLYYYDIANDKILTYEEYLATYNLTVADIEWCYYYTDGHQEEIQDFGEPQNGDIIWGEVVGAIIYEDEIDLYVDVYSGMGGYSVITVPNNFA